MIVDILKNKIFSALEVMCSDANVKTTKTGKSYYAVTIRDVSASISAKIWNINPNAVPFEKGDVVICSGTVSEYNGEKQLEISSWQKIDTPDLTKFCPKSKFSVESLWSKISDLISSVTDTGYRGVLDNFFMNEEFRRKFLEHSAANKVHHACIGGLAQHTFFVTNICARLAKLYQLDYDLAVTAALLHDIGKLSELSDFPDNAYTVEGTFYGHISEGAYQVRKVCENIPDMTHDKTLNLVHCILAHHGQLEFGSPVLPAISEALLLHFADSIDAKLQIGFEQLDTEAGARNWYLGTSFYPTERSENIDRG